MKRKPQIDLGPARAQLLDPALETVMIRVWRQVHSRIRAHLGIMALWQLADDVDDET